MTTVAKASAFPKSVQPGVPRLGALPVGWSRGPLSEHLFEEVRPLKMDNDAEYRLVTVKRSRGGVVLREKLKGHEISVKSQFYVRAGDFLISKRQIVHGACGLVPKQLDGSIVSNEYAVLRSHKSVDLKFLTYLAHSTYFQQTCFHSAIGVHVEKMIFKLDKWLDWTFDLPPLFEQRRIAEILSTWDRAIETVEKLIANARAQKKALMQHLLTGKARSEKWRKGRLAELLSSIDAGVSVNSGDRPCTLSEVGVLKTSCVSAWSFDPHENKVIVAEVERKRLQEPVRAETIIISRMNTPALVGASGFVERDYPNLFLPDRLWALKPNPDRVYPRWLALFLAAPNTREAISNIATGTSGSMKNIAKPRLGNLKIHIPPLAEQRRIARILSTWDRTIEQQEKLLAKTRAEKSALMQQLLTGKRRVKLPSAVA